jgi:two-component system OmpR family response regulator
VPLTGGEYDLLVALVDRANTVLKREMLLDLLRGRQAGPAAHGCSPGARTR